MVSLFSIDYTAVFFSNKARIMSKKLLVCISSHGFGHFALSAPVLNSICEQQPQLELIIDCGHSSSLIKSRVKVDFTHIHSHDDFGFAMHSAFTVDKATSLSKYQHLLANWETCLAKVSAEYAEIEANLVVSNISFIALAAAQRLGLRNIACCPLNWADLFNYFFAATKANHEILQIMQKAYNQAEAFYCPEPSMPMPLIQNTKPVGPIALVGANRTGELRQQLALAENTLIILLSMGGIETELDLQSWPYFEGVHWIVSANKEVSRCDMSELHCLDFDFNTILASVDGIMMKPGYGMVVESVCNQKPVICVERPDWPEAPALVAWLEKHGRVYHVDQEAYRTADFSAALSWLNQQPAFIAPTPVGIKQMSEHIQSYLIK